MSGGGASAGRSIPTLDLHGMRREPAVKELVAFLERHLADPSSGSCAGKPPSVVRVITGLGQHSSSQGGPVLRHAVQEFLQRRGFAFGWERGCFTVHVAKGNGGSLTYHRQASDEDTKLVLMDGQQQQQHSPRRKQHLQGRIVSSSQIAGGSGNAMIRHSASSNSDLHQLMAGPSLAEVARADAELARGKEESLQAYRLRLKQVHRERREYETVLKQSQAEVVVDEEEEQALIRKAIVEEQRLLEWQEQEEEELIQKAIEEEQKLLEQQQREEDEMLQRALEMSGSSAYLNYCDDDCEDEDEMLRRALELSSQEQQQEFSTIGSIYLNNQEDELLQQAIRASQQQMGEIMAADDDAGSVPTEGVGTTSSVVGHNNGESCGATGNGGGGGSRSSTTTALLCHEGGKEHDRKDDDEEEKEDAEPAASSTAILRVVDELLPSEADHPATGADDGGTPSLVMQRDGT